MAVRLRRMSTYIWEGIGESALTALKTETPGGFTVGDGSQRRPEMGMISMFFSVFLKKVSP